MNFIAIKFEQTKRALTRQRAINSLKLFWFADSVVPRDLCSLFVFTVRRGRRTLQPNAMYVTNPVGGGSHLPTRSNRKTIATGNLRPRPPKYANMWRKFCGLRLPSPLRGDGCRWQPLIADRSGSGDRQPYGLWTIKSIELFWFANFVLLHYSAQFSACVRVFGASRTPPPTKLWYTFHLIKPLRGGCNIYFIWCRCGLWPQRRHRRTDVFVLDIYSLYFSDGNALNA